MIEMYSFLLGFGLGADLLAIAFSLIVLVKVLFSHAQK